MKTALKTVLIVTIMFGCTKNAKSPLIEKTNTAQEDLSTQYSNATKIITAHAWMYQGFYSHYKSEQDKGQRFYDRDSTNNLDEYLSGVVYSFKKNNTFSKYVKPYLYKGTWQFSDAVPTFLILKYSYGKQENDSLLVLSTEHLNYLRKDGYSQWYTELIPAKHQ